MPTIHMRAQRHTLSPRRAGALQKMLPLVCTEKTEATDSPAACIRHMEGKPSFMRLRAGASRLQVLAFETVPALV